MFLRAIDQGSTSSKLLFLRSWPSRSLACAAAGDRASPWMHPGIGGDAASPRGGDSARGFPSTTSLRRLSSAFSPRATRPSPPPPPPSSNLPCRSFAADAARSLDNPSNNKRTKLVSIPLAQTGEGLKEVEIVSWRVKVGDEIQEFDPLCHVQSDKAAVEITSRFSGVVEKLCYGEGDMVEVGAALCELRVEVEGEEEGDGEGNGGSAEVENVSPSSSVSASSVSTSSTSHSISLASPAVRRVARELGLSDLSSVRGTGPGGRVLKEDVERSAAAAIVAGGGGSAVGASSSAAAAAASSSPAPENPSTNKAPPPPPPPLGEEEANTPLKRNGNGHVVLPLRGYRRAMVSAMTSSLTVPHFHFMDEYPVDKLMEARRALADDPKLQGAKLTLLPFIIKAISLTLGSSESQHAVVNASLNESRDSLIIHADHNIGVAVDTPRGLVVPVVRRVQDLSVAEVAAELSRLQSGLLSSRAGGDGAGGLLPESDLSGATLTVSNIGSLGGTWATPLVHPPQAAIVALGRVRPKLVLVEREREDGGGSDEARGGSRGSGKKNGRDKKTAPPTAPSLSAVPSLPMSWGADHRVVDGAGLAKFAAAVGALLSEPARMLLHSR